MRFIVALLIASLFVDKADSELSFIPRPKACIHALHISRSQQYSHPYPITSIPQASYPFSFDRGGGASPNRKTPIGFRDNQARTDDFHHVKVTLYRWVISLPGPRTKESGRETKRHYSWTTWSRAFFSHYYVMDSQIMGKIGFHCQLLLSEIGLTTDSSHSTWFPKIRFPDLNRTVFTWRRFFSACSIRDW